MKVHLKFKSLQYALMATELLYTPYSQMADTREKTGA